VTVRDDLVRAAVYAYPANGTLEERILATCRVLNVHRLWPLAEYAEALLAAERLVADAGAEDLRWYAMVLRDPSLAEARSEA